VDAMVIYRCATFGMSTLIGQYDPDWKLVKILEKFQKYSSVSSAEMDSKPAHGNQSHLHLQSQIVIPSDRYQMVWWKRISDAFHQLEDLTSSWIDSGRTIYDGIFFKQNGKNQMPRICFQICMRSPPFYAKINSVLNKRFDQAIRLRQEQVSSSWNAKIGVQQSSIKR